MHSYMLTHKLNPKKWKWCTVTFDEGAELGWQTVFIQLYPSEKLAERDAASYNSTRIHNECRLGMCVKRQGAGFTRGQNVRYGH